MKYAAELRKDGYDFELKAHEAQASDKEHERLIQHDISINRGEALYLPYNAQFVL